MQRVNDLNQTPLYFGSKRLLEKLGVSNQPINFIVRKSDKSLNDKKELLRKRSSRICPTTPKIDLLKDLKFENDFGKSGNMQSFAPLY